MQYQVYESVPFGQVRIAGTIEAEDDREARKLARKLLPLAAGELRRDGMIVYRFGTVTAEPQD